MSISEKVALLRYRFKAKQIAESLVSLKTDALKGIYMALTEAGRGSVRPFPDPSDEVLLQAYQALCYSTMFGLHPEYVSTADRNLLLGWIGTSAKENQNVWQTMKIMLEADYDLYGSGMAMAAIYWGVKQGETCEDPGLQLVAIQIQLIGLSTQQVVALAFKDQESVLELQAQKLEILEQFN